MVIKCHKFYKYFLQHNEKQKKEGLNNKLGLPLVPWVAILYRWWFEHKILLHYHQEVEFDNKPENHIVNIKFEFV